jgi:imidazolonepropionase
VVVDRTHVDVPDTGAALGAAIRSGAGGPMSTVYTNIAELVTNDPTVGDGSPLGLLTDAALVVDDGGRWVGAAAAPAADDSVDLGARR